MKLIYHGPHDGVEVPLVDGRVVEAMHGQPVEFPEKVAQSLLEQSTWKAAGEPAADQPKNKKAAKAEEDKL